MRTWRGSTQTTVCAHESTHARTHALSHARTHTHTELYAVAPRRVRKLISHDWAAGYVSPFRPTDEQRADEIMARTGACMSGGSKQAQSLVLCLSEREKERKGGRRF